MDVQRQIELQAPEDLIYLVTNARTAAAEHINAAFPPLQGRCAGELDEMRRQIEQLVDQYLVRTFSLAVPNLSINGLPAAGLLDPALAAPHAADAFQPFDAGKRQRLAQLAADEEDLLHDIIQLKRRVPATAAAARADCDRAADAAADAAVVPAHQPAAAVVPLNTLDVADAPDVLARAVATLGRLGHDMPVLVARMERARVAAEYVVTEGS